jgi:hypothetical protein
MIKLKEKLKSELNSLIGKECWSIVGGEGTDSIISLDLGEKILRTESVDNQNLSDDAQKFDAEFDLFITCVWRLDSPKKIICGAWDNNSKNGRMLTGLNKLIGEKIVAIEVVEPAFDLIVKFSNSFKLTVFCDQTNGDKYTENYSLFTPQEIISVVRNSRIELDTRKYE